MRQPSVVELADRLQRRHVGAVLGTLDLASDRTEIRLTRQLWEPERRMTIGLGWVRTKLPSGDLWWHNGGTGGFRSFAGFSPERGEASVVLVNDVLSPDRIGVEALPSLRRRPIRRGRSPC